jgi:hypothetical protein
MWRSPKKGSFVSELMAQGVSGLDAREALPRVNAISNTDPLSVFTGTLDRWLICIVIPFALP